MLKYINLETMNLGKIKNLIYSFGEKEDLIEELSSNVISSDEIPGAIPAYISKEGNEYKVRYHISNEITLKQYFKDYIGRDEISKIIENIASIISKAQLSNIDLNNYLLNIGNVYIDRDTKEISLVYIPFIEKNSEEISFTNYIKEVLVNVKYNLNDDLNFFVSLHNYLNEKESSINEIASFIKSIKTEKNKDIDYKKTDKNAFDLREKEPLFTGKNIDIKGNEIKFIEDTANIKISDGIDKNDKPLAIHISTNSVNLENNNYYYENSKSDMDNEENFGTTIIDDEDDEFSAGTTVLGYEDYEIEAEDESGTTLLGMEDEEEEEEIPSLLRKSTNEIFEINKRRIKVGREASSCDFIITNNKLVGRIHAIIINENGSYYIEDNNSTNGTFINGVRLSKMGRGLIKQGDEIKLANEIFTIK